MSDDGQRTRAGQGHSVGVDLACNRGALPVLADSLQTTGIPFHRFANSVWPVGHVPSAYPELGEIKGSVGGEWPHLPYESWGTAILPKPIKRKTRKLSPPR